MTGLISIRPTGSRRLLHIDVAVRCRGDSAVAGRSRLFQPPDGRKVLAEGFARGIQAADREDRGQKAARRVHIRDLAEYPNEPLYDGLPAIADYTVEIV
jgi:hypothetical protein